MPPLSSPPAIECWKNHSSPIWVWSVRVTSAPFTVVAGYWRTNATLTYNTPDRRFSVTGFVNNIENNATPEAVGTGLNFPGIPLLPVTLKPPRTFGVRVGAHF